MNNNNINGLTRKTLDEWKSAFGWAPDSTANKLDKAMLRWIIELTSCLDIWANKGDSMTDGELILARVNMGSLVECWLKFFYCIYCEDYYSNPIVNRKGTVIEPNDMKLETLKVFSRGLLWETGDDLDKWVEQVQLQRNAIHAFNFRDIGKPIDYEFDMITYYNFIEMIVSRLPDSPANREYC